MPPRLPALLVTAACALLLPQPAQASVTAAELDALVDRHLDSLYLVHLPWGGFQDPLTGPQFNYGAVALAWLAGERLPERRAEAIASLRYGTGVKAPGAFQIWLEAEAIGSDWIDAETRAALAGHLEAYVAPIVGRRALACQRRADCYNNLKLVDAVASLALVRTGLVSSVPGARLADPAATERAARSFLDSRVPSVQRRDLRITRGGKAAVLSDPTRNPLAYHALSTAMLMRAVRLGAGTGARDAARRALWALVGLSDPRGTVAWMGRGQEHTWANAATVYAALAGAFEFAAEPALADRLRRLAQLAFAELGAREADHGLAVVPGLPRVTLAGADKSQNAIVCNGLTLAFLHLAAGVAAPGRVAPIPAELAGSVVVDPTAAGVAAVRGSKAWFAVHREATHPRDARYDVGLLSAQVLVDGAWRSVVGQRPNTDGASRLPTAGPVLVRGGRALLPAGRVSARPGSIVLSGAWRGGGEPVGATWRYSATSDGVVLRTPCQSGARLRMLEWTPAEPRRGRFGVALPGRSVRFSSPVRAWRIAGAFASAAHERLTGVALETRCDGRPVTIAWRASR
jgi:hypothetical protein